jgi:Ca2+-transporting ATPase
MTAPLATPARAQATEPVPGVPAAWRLDGEAVAEALETSVSAGLSSSAAAERLERVGPNELVERRQRSPWLLLLDQFRSAMILVLLTAAVVTTLVGDTRDTIVILAIVVFNGVIGFVQEYRAEQAMDALKRMSSPEARVVRDGEARLVPAREVVPGDVMLLEQGDIVTADLRLLEAPALRVNEAPLTGESEPVSKITAALPDADGSSPGDLLDMAFSGTAVTAGRARGIVVATGMGTAIGHIAELLQEGGEQATPLQKRLGELGRWLAVAAILICALVFVSGLLRGEDPEEMFLIAVSLAVAAIPEGLPAVVTISLALGARRMAQRRALVRRLPAVETLGSVSVICSDKTGTLTENRMLVEHLWTPAREYAVSGDGYAPEGTLTPSPEDDQLAVRAGLVAAVCNDATLVHPSGSAAGWSITGDPTEGALLAFAGKLGLHQAELRERAPRRAEVGFDAERRRMTTVHAAVDGLSVALGGLPVALGGLHWVAVKGALESVAPLLARDQSGALAAARGAAERYAQAGYRVLALADGAADRLPDDPAEVEHDLRLVGVVALADPPREAAARAIAECRAAGISPVMVTGDHQLTASAIGERLGILGDGRASITGHELAEMDDAAFEQRVAGVAIYARTSPEQKLRIVDAWRARGAVVAMTGDGVNDAPALRRADIGVAMGITGTDVSKEASDMIIADDDFATIVAAVEEGRRIFANIRRFVRYMLTTNSAEIWVMVLAPFLGLPLPLMAIQILWMNLVTDGAPALSLGVEPAHAHAMTRPPRRPGASILGDGLWQHAVWVGLLMGAATLAVQGAAIELGWQWQTMVFTVLSTMQLAHALAVRSERASTIRLGFRTNMPLLITVVVTALIQLAPIYVPLLQPIFETQALGPQELLVVALVTPLPFLAVELEKWAFRRRDARRGIPADALA